MLDVTCWCERFIGPVALVQPQASLTLSERR